MPGDGIGSVSFEVVPDARGFVERFRQQTERGMSEAGRRAGAEWERGFRAGAGSPEVNVRVNTRDAKRQADGLLASLLPLAPAVVPLAGAAALAGGALVSMGASGAVAIKGIRDDIKAANSDGLKFSAGLGVLKSDLTQVARTSAHATLTQFQQTTAKLHADVPALNSDLQQSSKVLADIAGHLLGAAIGGEHTFAPALLAVEKEVDRLAGRFESWATGPGGQKFAASLADDFSKAEPVIANTAGAIGKVAAELNGAGLGALSVFGQVAKDLNTDIGSKAAATLLTTILSFKAVSTISRLFDRFAVSVRGAAVAEGEAAAASAGLRSKLAFGVGVVGKLSAAYLGASLAAGELKQASHGGLSSLDDQTRHLAEAGNALGDLFTGHFKSFAHDLGSGRDELEAAAEQGKNLRETYRSIVFPTTQLKGFYTNINIANQREIQLTQSLIAGHAVYGKYTLGQELAIEQTKDLADNTRMLQGTLSSLQDQSGGVTKLVASYGAAGKAVEANIVSGQKFLDLGGKQIDVYHGVSVTLGMYNAALARTGNAGAAVGYIRAQIESLGQNKAALQQLSDQQANLSTYVSDVGNKYKITTQQVDTYTSALGINTNTIAQGGVALSAAEAELGKFVADLKNGSTATADWLAAVQQFSDSADTAADRAQLIGAALRAANGDMLSFANTMVGAATANQQLVTDFKNLKSGVLDLKTGTIDYHNAAAAPLLGDLQNLQTAAMNAASATYQHENAIGKASAASDAFSVYVNDTRGALIKQADQLGLTKGQAKKLADEYFGIKNSGDLKKKIELIGKDQVLSTLKSILEDLDILAGKHTKTYVDVITQNIGAGSGHQAGSATAVTAAAGGAIRGPGSGTSDSIVAHLSNGEHVLTASDVNKAGGQDAVYRMRSAIQSGALRFASGGEVGGFSGVDYSGNANKYGATSGSGSKAGSTTYIVGGQSYASLQAATNAAKRLFKAQVALSVKIDDKDLKSFRQSLKGTVDQARSAFQNLLGDAKKLGISKSLAATLANENKRLDSAINDRNKLKDKLATLQQEFADVRNSVRDAAAGSFDVTSAGTGFDGQQPITFANIQAQATQAKNVIQKWAAGIKKLGSEGFNDSATGKAMLRDLATRGPSDYPEVQALLSASPKQLTDLIATDRTIVSTGAGLGTYIGQDLYGSQITAAKREIKVDEKSIDRIATKMGHQVTKAVKLLADRPINVYANGREILKVVQEEEKKQGRRN